MKLPSSRIRRILPKRIWHQIFFILFFLVVIPLMVLGTLLLKTSQKAIKTTVLRDHKEIAIHATGEIKEHIEGARESLLVTASILGTLHADPWRQETSIVELALRNSAFQRVSSMSLEGFEVATSELGTALQDRSAEQAFQEALSGKSYLSEVKISENHIPYLTVAEPIRQFGKITGILLADLNLRSVWELVDNIQVGKIGRAYLIDRQGRIIAHPDKKLVMKNANLSKSEVIQDILWGQAGSLEEVHGKGEPWLTSYAPIANLKWGLVITQPEHEVYSFSTVMKMQSFILIALSILAALFISFVLAHYMSRPMKDIIEGTQRIARGDFSHAFRIRRKNEVGKLLFSFNRMAHKLRKAQEVEKLSVIGKAATAVAHELKNSLQLIDTFIKLLPQRYEDKKFIKEFSDTIPKELDSFNTSLKNMMAYSKDVKFPVTELQVNSLVQDVALLAKFKARQMNIDFEVNLTEELSMIMGNEEKLKQVLLNMLTNALEATPSGGRIVITTRCVSVQETEYVVMEVMNTGSGIAAEDINHIFEPFYTTKNGGVGLGLSISKEIVERHQGSIQVASDKDKRTIFTIKIPWAQSPVQGFPSLESS